MAKKSSVKNAKNNGTDHGSNCNCCGGSWRAMYAIKGLILLLIGLALWGRFISLEATVALVLVLAGLKFLLVPIWCKN